MKRNVIATTGFGGSGSVSASWGGGGGAGVVSEGIVTGVDETVDVSVGVGADIVGVAACSSKKKRKKKG